MRRLKKILLVACAVLVINNDIKAQGLFSNIRPVVQMDLQSSNLLLFAAEGLATTALQTYLDYPLFESGWIYTPIKAEYLGEKLDVDHYDIVDFSQARSLFSDIGYGLKVGFQTYSMGAFNCGLYASVHYRLNQFKSENLLTANMDKQRIHRFLIGTTFFTTLGRLTSSVRARLEVGLRYSIVSGYKGSLGSSDNLNNGLVSHYAIKLLGLDFITGDIGAFVDINHFNLINNKIGGQQMQCDVLKPITIGLIINITPSQIDKRIEYYF